jgi:hypothetical protein
MLFTERVPRSPSTVAPEITVQGNRGTLDLDTFILNSTSYKVRSMLRREINALIYPGINSFLCYS